MLEKSKKIKSKTKQNKTKQIKKNKIHIKTILFFIFFIEKNIN